LAQARTPSYRLAQSILDTLALIDRAAGTPDRWKFLINDAVDFLRAYHDDPEPHLARSPAKLCAAFGEPKRWDSRITPKALVDVDRPHVSQALTDALDGLEKLTKEGTWPSFTPEEKELLSTRMDVRLFEHQARHFPEITAAENPIRLWIE
jgi:hypothetical protein